MEKVLIVEDNRVVSSMLKNRIESELRFAPVLARTFAEAKRILDEKDSAYFLCLADLHLPDAPGGEIVDYCIGKGLPTIVFTGEVSEAVREKVLSKKVIDYLLKEGRHNVDYIIKLMGRVYKNKRIKVLVVDDSRIFRARVADLLKVHLYTVYHADNGMEALEALHEHPDIRLVITDYNMPGMDGLRLVNEIRRNYSNEQLCIIGISGDSLLSAKFMKHGANDFLSKDFFPEELYCRVNQNIELLERIAEIKEASNKDFLTGLYNRRYFYEVGGKLFENSKRKNLTVTAAMIDIDFFKRINDEYGHDAGDRVLKGIASVLQKRFRASDVVSRIGGEEFCVLAVNMDRESVEGVFNSLREKIEETGIPTGSGAIRITVSIGVCTEPMNDLEEMIKQADSMLYKAKESGRNRVFIA